jgi:hypothetical protein
MQRLQQCNRYADWIDPLHEIAVEETGLSDFGEDKSYLTGLRVILEALDDDCDLNEVGKFGIPVKLTHMLKQRLLAEQAFKDKPEVLDIEIKKPVVITGLVRTGSTALHYLMARDPNRQHLQYWIGERANPRPPRDSWESNPDFQATQGALDMTYEMSPELKAIHYMAADWPEECSHLMGHTFTDDHWQCARRAPLYNEWYEGVDMVPTYTQHKKLIQLIGSNEPEKPWLLKYPVHLKHLESFLKVYPDAQVIWTHRDPATVMSSYVSLIAGFRAISARPETIDRDDILNEQMEIWASGAERALEARKHYPEAQFFDLHFEDFIADPAGQVKKAYGQFDIDWTPECETALMQWHDDNPQHKHGKHSHAREALATSREQIQERFSKYINHCGVKTK